MSSSTPNIGLTLPVGSERVSRQIINDNNTKIDTYAGAVNASLDGLREGLGILADGDTHAAITSGQFVYVKNHQTLPQGLYQATTNIAANAALSGSNLTADPKGGLNTLYEQIGTLDSKKAKLQRETALLLKNGGTATVTLELFSVNCYLIMIAGQWNTAWRYIGVLVKNDAGSTLIDINTSATLSVSVSGNVLTLTNNNAENNQNVTVSVIG